MQPTIFQTEIYRYRILFSPKNGLISESKMVQCAFQLLMFSSTTGRFFVISLGTDSKNSDNFYVFTSSLAHGHLNLDCHAWLLSIRIDSSFYELNVLLYFLFRKKNSSVEKNEDEIFSVLRTA